jgi:hypothetical protein
VVFSTIDAAENKFDPVKVASTGNSQSVYRGVFEVSIVEDWIKVFNRTGSRGVFTYLCSSDRGSGYCSTRIHRIPQRGVNAPRCNEGYAVSNREGSYRVPCLQRNQIVSLSVYQRPVCGLCHAKVLIGGFNHRMVLFCIVKAIERSELWEMNYFQSLGTITE